MGKRFLCCWCQQETLLITLWCLKAFGLLGEGRNRSLNPARPSLPFMCIAIHVNLDLRPQYAHEFRVVCSCWFSGSRLI
uniref:Secreted protein n=1 Tax=Malurus cyaneus samueli TaxID=2593467 RepID=A0A8C5UD63_9PASS